MHIFISYLYASPYQMSFLKSVRRPRVRKSVFAYQAINGCFKFLIKYVTVLVQDEKPDRLATQQRKRICSHAVGLLIFCKMPLRTLEDIGWNTVIYYFFGVYKFPLLPLSLTLSRISHRSCGAMDNASDYGSEDSRFESWQDRFVFGLGRLTQCSVCL